MLKKITQSKNWFMARLAAIVACLSLAMAGAASAQGETTIWTTAESAVSSAATSITALLIAMAVIPVAFFTWKLFKRVL